MSSRRQLMTGTAGVALVALASRIDRAKAWIHGSRVTPLVFSYYLISVSEYGYTVADYKQSIQDAQALGIDGFIIGLGAWSQQTNYQTWSAAMFTAAQQLGTGFLLFFSTEMGDGTTGITAADVHDMVGTYKGTAPASGTGISSTNYYWYAGKPMLTTYSNGTALGPWWAANVFTSGFVASFYPGPNTQNASGGVIGSNPALSDIVSNWASSAWAGIANGLYYFTFGGLISPDNMTMAEEAYAQFARNNSQQYLAGMSSYYAQVQPKNAFLAAYEMLGGEGIDAQWASIRNTQKPPWVVLNTWCDQGEAYICPASPASIYAGGGWNPNVTVLHPHVGFSNLNKYFIGWYKNNSQPAITNDQLFYFYRTQPAAIGAPSSAAFTASISGTTMTVTAISVGPIVSGATLVGAGITGGTTILGALTATPTTSGIGTYLVSASQTVGSESMTATPVAQTTLFFNSLIDYIFVTTILTAPATVRVINNGVTTDTTVASGLVHTRVAFTAGAVEIKLIRSASTLIDLTGEPIVSSSTLYDMNPTTGYGAYP